MTRRLVAVSLAMLTLAVCDACGSDGVTGADRSIVGRYALSRVFDVPMPATVKDPGTQYRLLEMGFARAPSPVYDYVFTRS